MKIDIDKITDDIELQLDEMIKALIIIFLALLIKQMIPFFGS